MKRNQAIKMLREWHEECIKAATALKKPYHAIVDESERTYSEGTTFSYSACIWDEERNEPAVERRWGYIYSFWSDDTCNEVYNDCLAGFKSDIEKLTKTRQTA